MILLAVLMGNIMISFLEQVFWTNLYIYLLCKLWVFLRHHNPALFVGFNATLIYGLFHETFKLGQGSFVLAFILALWATSLRNRKIK